MSSQGSRGTEKATLRGGHCSLLPRETVARLSPYFPVLGITRIADVTGLDPMRLPAVLVIRPNARSRSVVQGVGLDLDAARAAAVLESIEQFHAETIDRALKWGSYAELSREARLIDVLALPRSAREFDAHSPILWIEAEDFGTSERAWVPYELVHLNLTLPQPPGAGCFPLSTSGLASGNTFAEAAVQAAVELIERDAGALFRRLRPEQRGQRRLCLGSVDDPAARELLELLRRAELDVAVWDATSDIGIAVFHALLVDRHTVPNRALGEASGFGCHNDRGVALCRALFNAAQHRLSRSAGADDDLESLDESTRSSQTMPVEAARAELAFTAEPRRRFKDVPHAAFPTFEEDLAWIRKRLAGADLREVWLVNLGRPDVPVSVVRAIIPGLEFSADLPGRVPGRRALDWGISA